MKVSRAATASPTIPDTAALFTVTAAVSPAGLRPKNWTQNGFVVDFSSLKAFRQQLNAQFDHTFLVNSDDPLLGEWQRLHDLGALDLRVMRNVGMEGSAHWVWEHINALLHERDGGRSWCWKVEARENSTNATQWEAKPNWATEKSS